MPPHRPGPRPPPQTTKPNQYTCFLTTASTSADGTLTYSERILTPTPRTSAAALESVVAFASPWRVPVPVDIHSSQTLGDSATLTVRFAFGSGLVFLNQRSLVDVHTGIDSVDDSVADPLRFLPAKA